MERLVLRKMWYILLSYIICSQPSFIQTQLIQKPHLPDKLFWKQSYSYFFICRISQNIWNLVYPYPTGNCHSKSAENHTFHPFYLKMVERPLKRPKTGTTVTVKKDICQFKEKNPACTQVDILAIVYKHYNLSIGRSTVCDIHKEFVKSLHCED